jgi:hypothetical protein
MPWWGWLVIAVLACGTAAFIALLAYVIHLLAHLWNP